MGLLSKLKSLLGAGDDNGPRGSGVDVTVERAPDANAEPATEGAESGAGSETESVVDERGTEPDTGDGGEPPIDADDAESVAEGTDASASTGSMVDEEHAEDPTRAAEPSETGVADVDESTDEPVDENEAPLDEPGTDTDAEAESTTDAEADAVDVEDAGESVDTVKGIGPAYADRLRDAGVETVGDLAAADAEELADRVDLSAKRVGRWVDSANDR